MIFRILHMYESFLRYGFVCDCCGCPTKQMLSHTLYIGKASLHYDIECEP